MIANISNDETLGKYKNLSSALAKRLNAMDKSANVKNCDAVQMQDAQTPALQNVNAVERPSFAQMLSKISATRAAVELENTENPTSLEFLASQESLKNSRSVAARIVEGWQK